jgi:hypothetical protein
MHEFPAPLAMLQYFLVLILIGRENFRRDGCGGLQHVFCVCAARYDACCCVASREAAFELGAHVGLDFLSGGAIALSQFRDI